MNDIVIKVENLSKLYKLGLVHHDRLAEAITAGLKRTSASLRSIFSRESSANTLATSSLSSSSNPGPYAQDAMRSAPRSMPSSLDDTIWALRDVSFEVKRGEVLGIIGRNGAGKTTLLKILSGITEPTEGRIWMKGRVASLLEVGTGFHPELTGRENIFLNGAILGMTRVEIKKKFDEIVDFAEIDKFVDTPVKRYSSGMYVRLAFAVAAHLEPEILLVDEVLAVGDIAFQKKCLGKMEDVSKKGRTVLFVSHNMTAIRRLCPKALLFDSGHLIEVGESIAVTNIYFNAILKENEATNNLPSGYIFYNPDAHYDNECTITGIQLLNKAGEPMKTLRTWDYVRFRIYYAAAIRIMRGSVVLKVQTNEGLSLTLCSTQPDSNVSCIIENGRHYADCIFPKWPFAEGVYFIGAGLAVPGIHFLYWEETLCTLNVMEQDVFHSGLAPSSSRYFVATDHHWELPPSKL